ncbi:MAG: S9 family peptidase [candidate division KSB1 bacterium]|nr:S9 family peptidase [candidate division KSB1 bacterium]MDZ7393490.1 S9 family peptidase [candidate division KSB1 bacterium]
MRRQAAGSICALFCIVAVLGAQPRRMTFADLFRFSQVASPRLSPDGRFVLFAVTKADWDKNTRVTHLWRVATSDGEPVQMTRGDKSCTQPRWSPDGRVISFISSRDDKAQVYLMRADGGEAWKLTAHTTAVGSYEWSPDGERIYFTAPDAEPEAVEKRRKEKDDAYLYGQTEKNVHLWEFDIPRGTERRLTQGNMSVRTFAVAPGGRRIAFIAAPTPLVDDDPKNEIYLLELDSLTVRRLTTNQAIERSLAWRPDGKAITFQSDANENLETYYQDSIFLLDLATGEVRDLLPGFRWQVLEHFWGGKKRDTIYFTANMGVTTQLFSLSPARGTWQQLTDAAGVIGGLHYVAEVERLVCTRSDPYNPPDVYLAQLQGPAFQRLTRMNPLVDSLALARYQVIRWPSYDGTTVEGILITPPDYDPGKTYPLILQIHGGPESSYQLAFSVSWATYPHVLAGKGYVLLQPNYRGSTGYGDEWMRAIIGHYFEKDVDDLLSGVDHLVERGIVHPESLAVHGWSAGGHLTNWLITHTQRFRCASSGAGCANWFSFYAQTDMHYIREIWHASSPYQAVDFWLDKSPVRYAAAARTPTLLFWGENDKRVPFPQGQEMYQALRYFGCPVEMVVFPRAGHGPGELRHQMHKMKKEFAWFEHYLRGKEMPASLDEIE